MSITIKHVSIYITSDGKEFTDYQEAKLYEEKLTNLAPARVEQFKKSFSGSKLLKKYKLTDVGIWEVRGEDPNCDFGGHHHEPFIGKVRGRLEEVIEWAVQQPNWLTWGAGGSIKLSEEENIIDLCKSSKDIR